MTKIIIGLCLITFSFLLHGNELLIGVNERDIYRFKNESGTWIGKDIELVKAIFRRTPYSFNIVSMPWPRVLKSIEQGSVDLTLAAANLPERRTYAIFSKNKFRYSHYMLFVLKSRKEMFNSVKNLADVSQKDVLIGALRGAIYSNSFYELLKNQAFVQRLAYIDNDQNLPEFALKERVDAYIDSEIEGIHYLAKHANYNKSIEPFLRVTSDDEAGSHLMFSKKTVSTEIVKEFDEALRQLHDSGEYQTISEKFILKNNH